MNRMYRVSSERWTRESNMVCSFADLQEQAFEDGATVKEEQSGSGIWYVVDDTDRRIAEQC